MLGQINSIKFSIYSIIFSSVNSIITNLKESIYYEVTNSDLDYYTNIINYLLDIIGSFERTFSISMMLF